MSSRRVSIITPSYNQGQFVERTILSVLRQDYPNLQYIFVDALSGDATAAILDRYRSEIDIIIQERDEGQSDALNKGFARADGEILAYINADDCFASPNVVSQAVAELVQPRTGRELSNGAGQTADLIYGKRFYINEGGFFHNSYPFRPFNKEQLMQACYIPQECCFWTREIFERAGNYVSKEHHFAMDYDLWLRMLAAGAKFVAVDEVFALFRWYPGQKSNAEWETRGLPEIAALHQKYLGKVVAPAEMSRIFMEHYSGFNQATHPVQSELFDALWADETRLKREVLGFAPLDHWMFKRENVPGEREHAVNVR
ncbi:MAG TPA: glycosyltransferase family 2 protein [Chroococcales cyanobacterium]